TNLPPAEPDPRGGHRAARHVPPNGDPALPPDDDARPTRPAPLRRYGVPPRSGRAAAPPRPPWLRLPPRRAGPPLRCVRPTPLAVRLPACSPRRCDADVRLRHAGARHAGCGASTPAPPLPPTRRPPLSPAESSRSCSSRPPRVHQRVPPGRSDETGTSGRAADRRCPRTEPLPPGRPERQRNGGRWRMRATPYGRLSRSATSRERPQRVLLYVFYRPWRRWPHRRPGAVVPPAGRSEEP